MQQKFLPGDEARKQYFYYSTSSLTNQIAPFEGNNVGYYSMRACNQWQRVMTRTDANSIAIKYHLSYYVVFVYHNSAIFTVLLCDEL